MSGGNRTAGGGGCSAEVLQFSIRGGVSRIMVTCSLRNLALLYSKFLLSQVMAISPYDAFQVKLDNLRSLGFSRGGMECPMQMVTQRARSLSKLESTVCNTLRFVVGVNECKGVTAPTPMRTVYDDITDISRRRCKSLFA